MQVSLPTCGAGLPAYYVLAVSEASSNLARYDGLRYGARSPDAKELTVGDRLMASNHMLLCPRGSEGWGRRGGGQMRSPDTQKLTLCVGDLAHRTCVIYENPGPARPQTLNPGRRPCTWRRVTPAWALRSSAAS